MVLLLLRMITIEDMTEVTVETEEVTIMTGAEIDMTEIEEVITMITETEVTTIEIIETIEVMIETEEVTRKLRIRRQVHCLNRRNR